MGASADHPAHAETTAAEFRLAFDLPRTWWRASESVEGSATLAYLGTGGVDLGGSGGGLIVYRFERDGGPKVEPAMTADCAPYRLTAGTPMSSPLSKSGGFSADDPDASFFRSFFADPGIQLTAGDWTVTAMAVFIEGVGCGGPTRTLEAPIRVHVAG